MNLDMLCSNFVKLSSAKKLYVFDFDNTLFNSPNKPAQWSGGWWGRPESLDETYPAKNGNVMPKEAMVPKTPGPEWWIADTVSAAREAIADPNIYAVMLTGRHKGFTERVSSLLASQGLSFDEVHLCDGDDTLPFKLRMIKGLIASVAPTTVEVWEDRAEHVEAFNQFLSSIGLEYKVHHVT